MVETFIDAENKTETLNIDAENKPEMAEMLNTDAENK